MQHPIRLTLTSPSKDFNYTVLEEGSYRIGRSHGCDFSVPIEDLSREHALLEVQNDLLFITDLGSRNGVWLNGKRLPPNTRTQFREGDDIFLSKSYHLSINVVEISDHPKVSQHTNSKIIRPQLEGTTKTMAIPLELEERPEKIPLTPVRKKIQKTEEEEEETKKNMEPAKMVLAFIFIFGFVIYQLLKD